MTPGRPTTAGRSMFAQRFSVVMTAICCLGTLAACGGSGGAKTTDASPTIVASPRAGSPIASPIPSPTAPPTATPYPTPRPSALIDTIDALLAEEPGVYGVLITTPDEGEILYSRNADTPFVTASLYKLVLIADMFRRRERGKLSFDQTVELKYEYFHDWDPASEMYFDDSDIGSFWRVDDLLWAVGVYSSNIGARALLSLSSAAALNQTAKKIGMPNTHLLVDLDDVTDWPPVAGADVPGDDLRLARIYVETAALEGTVNLSTPRDMANYFTRLHNGKLVSRQASAEILSILSNQAINDRIPVFLPEGASVAHKPGNLPGASHDVGIVQTPDGPVILSVMVEDAWDKDRTAKVIQRIALAAYGEYDLPPMPG